MIFGSTGFRVRDFYKQLIIKSIRINEKTMKIT